MSAALSAAAERQVTRDVNAALRILDHLPDLILNERKRRGITQRTMANETGIGVSEICRYERRTMTPSFATLIVILTWIDRGRRCNCGDPSLCCPIHGTHASLHRGCLLR